VGKKRWQNLRAYYDKEKLKQELNGIRLYEEQLENIVRTNP
jgi:hypothetical protein